MKALFISNDPSIKDSSSPVYARMQSYADAIGTLHILLRSDKNAVSTARNLTVHEVKTGKLFASSALANAARKLVLSEKIEVVSAQDPFEYGRAALIAVKGTSAKLHIQVHTDFLSPWFTRGENMRAPKIHMPLVNKVRQKIADSVLPRADGIRVVSKRVKDSLIARYGSSIRVPTIIPIAAPGELPPKVALPEHPFTFALMTVSRLEPEKRIDDILVAISQIATDFPSVGLFIVGDGSERKHLEELTQKLHIEDRILFLGWRTDALGLMQSAQVYIQASAYEGYGLAIIEAALARIPIITTDVGIVGEVFTGYEDVFAVPPGDPTALGNCIKSLVQNHQSREELARAAEIVARGHLAHYGNQPKLIAEDLARILSPKVAVIGEKAY